MRSVLAACLVLAAGISLLWWGTDGFQAYTAEGARRLAVLEQPREVPAVTLEDQNGQETTFAEYQGKLLLMTFVYTRCGDVCPALEKSFQEVYEGLSPEQLRNEVAMLTVSFDPDNDSVHALHHYAEYFGADGTNWKMTRIPDTTQLNRLLDQFGVVVIPDGKGGYEHNAAMYMIDEQGKLVQIYDADQPKQVLQDVNNRL